MSTQFNEELNEAQANVQPTLEDETRLSAEELDEEDLEAVAGGAVVLGTGGIEVSLTPLKARSTLLPV